MRLPLPDDGNDYLAAHAALLARSHRHWTGRELIAPAPDAATLARALFNAPFVLLSHDTAPDPVLNYGNLAALALWETDWQTLTAMPSRLTAERAARADRERLLERVNHHGFLDDYQGVRVTSSGRRFHIERATVWTLVDAAGAYRGQAAAFSRWEYL